MPDKFTLEDLTKIKDECLTPQQVADVLNVSVRIFLKTARNEPDSLGFPIIKIGERIKIPKEAFLNFMSGRGSGKN